MQLGVVQREPSTTIISHRLLEVCTLSALLILLILHSSMFSSKGVLLWCGSLPPTFTVSLTIANLKYQYVDCDH